MRFAVLIKSVTTSVGEETREGDREEDLEYSYGPFKLLLVFTFRCLTMGGFEHKCVYR